MDEKEEFLIPASVAADAAMMQIESLSAIIDSIIRRHSQIAYATQLEVARRYHSFLHNEELEVFQRIGELEALTRK